MRSANQKIFILVLCALLSSNAVFGQRTVSGTVTDYTTGETLPFATVRIQGTTQGTATSVDGTFSITIPAGAVVLEFSMTGYETLALTADANRSMNVRLRMSAIALEAVVITGLFERRAESFTGSHVHVHVEELKAAGSSNVLESLRNIDPSLAMMDNFEFGSDPNRMPSMELRGTSSFNFGDGDGSFQNMFENDPNQPLFILDGFEVSIQRVFDLDMSRVESVTILKDAAAKAIHGARAANGVVVIETRRAQEGIFRVTYRGSLNITLPDLTSYNLTNALEKLDVERLAGLYNSGTIQGMLAFEEAYNFRRNRALSGVNTDWLSKPLRAGIGTRHAVGLDMTQQRLNVLADISYNHVAGVMRGSNRETIAGSVGVTYRTADRRFLFRNMMSVTSNNASDSPYGTFHDFVRMNPYHEPFDENGNLVRTFPTFGMVHNQTNPLWNAQLNTSLTSNYFNFSNNFIAEWSPIENLRLRGRFGLENQRQERDEFFPAQHTRFVGWDSESLRLRRGSYTHSVGRMSRFSGDVSVSYNRAMGNHLIMSNLAFNMSESSSMQLNYVAEGFPSDRMNSMIFARAYALDGRPSGFESIVRDVGVVGLLSYSYDNRYMVDVTARTSASSQFAPDRRWGMFWSVGAGWNVHNEQWARQVRWLDRLRLRSSIGSTGTQNVPSFLTITTFNYYTDDFYRTFRPQNPEETGLGVRILRLANEELMWQQKLDFNVGFDAQIARFSVSFDYYISTTNNLITDLALPPSTGFHSISENAGQVENTGVDVRVTYRVIQRRDFFFNITGAVSQNRNTLRRISDALRHFNEQQDALVASYGEERWTPPRRYVEGGSMNAIWAVPSLGINPQNGLEIFVRPDGSTTYVWNTAYQQIVGEARERFRGNIGFSSEFRGFGVSMIGRFLGGGQLYNSTLVQRVENAELRDNVDRRVLEGRWSTDNRNAPFRALEQIRDENGNLMTLRTQPTSRFVQDRNEFTIAAVNVYYDFARLPFVRSMGFRIMRLSFNMNEVHQFSSIRIERGTTFPFARTLSLSLSAEF